MNQKRVVGGVGAVGGVVAAFVGDLVPFLLSFMEGSLDPEQLAQLGRMLEVVLLAVGGYTLAAWNTPEAPLRSAMPRSIVLMALTGALLVPGVTGCAGTMDQFKSLSPQGRYDVAKAAAVDVSSQLTTQAGLVVMDMNSGLITEGQARETYLGLRAAQKALEQTIRTADVLRSEDPDAALAALEAAAEAARLELRRRVR